MDNILIQMIEIYKPNGIDWMNYIHTNSNYYSYHHIHEQFRGGKRTVKNGAILTRDSHNELNYLYNRYNRVYNELNGLFLELNRTYRPPVEAYYDEVDRVLRRVR